ncbi:MAG: FAD-dependent oxidoreductase [Candidatus Latescibacteria bacterium]|nr:FAD-dependent oxidoreductase [Candidatus Latescibacterota bacterium]
MEKNKLGDRRYFLKTLSLSGLVFSGIEGFSCAQDRTGTAVKTKHWDVIVIGGGPGGVPAAVAAARGGARVLLVEAYGFLGGMATSALVLPYMKYSAGGKYIVRGLFEDFLDRMEEHGAIKKMKHTEEEQVRLNTFTTDLEDRAHFDDEPMKWVLDRFVADSGADVLLHTNAVGVLKEDSTIKAVRVFHKGGIEDLSADIFIDSTGDGDIAAWAGAQVEIGRDLDNACQPMTTSFRMARVNFERLPNGKEINRLFETAKKNGEITNPRENVLKFHTVHEDVMHFNSTRVVGKTSLNGWDMTDAEIEGRRQVDELVKFLKKYVSGFEDAYLMKTGTQIGIRESRRIMGNYILTADDVIKGRKFDDGVACGSYAIDIHNPTGTGTQMHYLDWGIYYNIPYRCLVPTGLQNLIVASRCISATHEAHSSLRVMPTVWAVGHAGGTAGAQCIKGKTIPASVDIAELRKKLIQEGAVI